MKIDSYLSAVFILVVAGYGAVDPGAPWPSGGAARATSSRHDVGGYLLSVVGQTLRG